MSPINNFFTWLILPGRIIGVIIPATDLTSMTQNKSSELPNSCLVWPWRGVNNEKISLKEIIITRKFTLIYLGISYLLILLLGFASTRNCTETWQLALYCKYSFLSYKGSQMDYNFGRGITKWRKGITQWDNWITKGDKVITKINKAWHS